MTPFCNDNPKWKYLVDWICINICNIVICNDMIDQLVWYWFRLRRKAWDWEMTSSSYSNLRLKRLTSYGLWRLPPNYYSQLSQFQLRWALLVTLVSCLTLKAIVRIQYSFIPHLCMHGQIKISKTRKPLFQEILNTNEQSVPFLWP